MKLKNLFCFLLTCIVVSGISASNFISNEDHRFLPFEAGTWEALGEGLNNVVYDIAVISDSAIYVGGFFTNAGGIPEADLIAKWNGSSWEALGIGIQCNHSQINAVAASDTEVYVGGTFTDANGDTLIDHIAKWNGSSWIPLGTGLNDPVFAILIVDSVVYVGGSFTDAGGIPEADYVAKWNGSTWEAVGGGLNGCIYTIKKVNQNIIMGGSFTNAGGNPLADNIVKWDDVSWQSVGGGLNNYVLSIVISGNDIYVCGYFTDAGGNPNADHVAKWEGSTWHNLGSLQAFSFFFETMEMLDGRLYAGGLFSNLCGNPYADGISVWNGSSWGALGTGIDTTILSIKACDGLIFVGGSFLAIDNNYNLSHIAKWIPNLGVEEIGVETTCPINLISVIPNPTANSNAIFFEVKTDCRIRIEVFNVSGQKVATILDKNLTTGNYRYTWNGKDFQGNLVQNGSYFCRVQSGDYSKTLEFSVMR